MRMHQFATIMLIGCGSLTAASPALAQADLYVGGSVGKLYQQDSNNSGRTGAFTTGEGGPLLPAGTAVPAGSPLSFKTKFNDGYSVSAELGFFYDSGLRSGIEVNFSSADVNRHQGAKLAGVTIDEADAAVLTGSPTPTGTTVGQALNNSRGNIENASLFANLYYDFNRERAIRPYVGGGIGVSRVEVKYAPSAITIIDDYDTKFAYQGKAGLSWSVNDRTQVYGEYAYRKTDDVDFRNKLLGGNLNVENEQQALSIGVRYRTGIGL